MGSIPTSPQGVSYMISMVVACLNPQNSTSFRQTFPETHLADDDDFLIYQCCVHEQALMRCAWTGTPEGKHEFYRRYWACSAAIYLTSNILRKPVAFKLHCFYPVHLRQLAAMNCAHCAQERGYFLIISSVQVQSCWQTRRTHQLHASSWF